MSANGKQQQKEKGKATRKGLVQGGGGKRNAKKVPLKVGLSRPTLRRLMYRANVTRAADDAFAPLKEDAARFVRVVLRDATILLAASRRSKLTPRDLRRALARHGVVFLGLPKA